MAAVTVNWFMGRDVVCVWAFSAIAIGTITVAYMPRIRREIKKYNKIILRIRKKEEV